MNISCLLLIACSIFSFASSIEIPTDTQVAKLSVALSLVQEEYTHNGEKDNNSGWGMHNKKYLESINLNFGKFDIGTENDKFSFVGQSTGWFLIEYDWDNENLQYRLLLDSMPDKYVYKYYHEVIDGFNYKVEMIYDKNRNDDVEQVQVKINKYLRDIESGDPRYMKMVNEKLLLFKKSRK